MIFSTSEERFKRAIARRAPADLFEGTMLSACVEDVPGAATRYLVTAMKPIDSVVTARLVGEGNRVEKQLRSALIASYPDLEFRRQGSVSNDTHIRFHSDVDVLVIIDKFYTLEPPQKASNPYRGKPVADLLSLRKNSVESLRQKFPAVFVSDAGSTSISMTGGSLACKVDAVPCNWYDTLEYTRTRAEIHRAIQVLNKVTEDRNRNKPFLFNFRLDARDKLKTNRLRQLIRLMKTVKADLCEDGQAVACTSFDICSIVYRMPDEHYNASILDPLALLENLIDWLSLILYDEELRKSLKVVDDSRSIFRGDEEVDGLRLLRQDLKERVSEARREVGTIKYSTTLPFGDQRRYFLAG